MLTLRQIEVARAVMVTGTLAGAAKLLNVSAPGISRLMKYTESSLGLRLFDWRGGRLVPSPQAHEIFEQISGGSARRPGVAQAARITGCYGARRFW